MVAGVPVELHLDRIDLHGNVGPAVNVSTDVNTPVLTLEPSTSGPGYWTMTPKMAGSHAVALRYAAILSLDVTFNPGMAVRLFVEVDGRLMAQGETALVSVYGVDVRSAISCPSPRKTWYSHATQVPQPSGRCHVGG